jgi:hypothetical protein
MALVEAVEHNIGLEKLTFPLHEIDGRNVLNEALRMNRKIRRDFFSALRIARILLHNSNNTKYSSISMLDNNLILEILHHLYPHMTMNQLVTIQQIARDKSTLKNNTTMTKATFLHQMRRCNCQQGRGGSH